MHCFSTLYSLGDSCLLLYLSNFWGLHIFSCYKPLGVISVDNYLKYYFIAYGEENFGLGEENIGLATKCFIFYSKYGQKSVKLLYLFCFTG